MNTTVIIIMIVCATVISLVAIICDHLFERKTDTSENYPLAKKIIKIHRNYIAGILGFAVIMLITARYGGPENAIFTYLSFASTITSLVLSILAIFVTVQSSSDLYKQFARIDNATDAIKKYSIQIDKTVKVLEKTESDLGTTAKEISDAVDDIVNRLDERLQKRMKETEDVISKQVAESMNKLSEEKQPTQPSGVSSEETKKYFLDVTSASGLLALYACTLSIEKKKMFELSNLFSGSEAYTFGYLIAAFSSDVIRFTNDDKNNQITGTHSIFNSDELYALIKEKSVQFGTDYLNQVNVINNFFGISPLNFVAQ